MWYRDATLVEERMARLNAEAREAELRALARSDPPARRGRTRVATAAAVRRLGRAALATAAWIDARTPDEELSRANGIAWHHS